LLIEEITSIEGRLDEEKGMVMPFICTAGGRSFYVKGSNTLAVGLINELVCAHLARAFGLPVPDFAVLRIDDLLKEVVSPDWAFDLQYEYLFGSASVVPCEKITLSDVQGVAPELQRDLIVFDAWVRNEDRSLTELDGNPNLLVTLPGKDLMVIDHNLAFDDAFDEDAFRRMHVFAGVLAELPVQLPEQADYAARFDAALIILDEVFDLIPDEWLESLPDPDGYLKKISQRLGNYKQDYFWGLLS
jgi:hypothetical protein